MWLGTTVYILWFYNPNFVPDILGAEPFIPMEESKYSRR